MQKSKKFLLSSLALLSVAGQVAAAPKDSAAKCDLFLTRLMSEAGSEKSVSLILKYKKSLTPANRASLEKLGATIGKGFAFIDSVMVQAPQKNLAKLAALPFVERLSANVAVRKFDEFTTGATGATVATDRYGVTGKGVTVAVLDSGIALHPDLDDSRGRDSRVIEQVDFVRGWSLTNDQYGHGTHVAGIIAGNGASSTGPGYTRTFAGIAPQSKLVSVRVLDALGGGDTESVLDGIDWVIRNRAAYGIRVINLSLGHAVGESYTTDPLCRAVEKAWKAGIVVVCAAGNDGRKSPLALYPTIDNEGYGAAYGTVTSPGNDPYVITVGSMKAGATRSRDQIATYSGRGPSRLDFVVKPDIVAPGNAIVSLRRPLSTLELTSPLNIVPPSSYIRNPGFFTSSSYFQLSGTSMAAPVVAGAVALLLEARPNLTPDTVKARLMLSADKWQSANGQYDPCTYGAGYLNIPAALNSTVVPTTPAFSPTLTRGADGSSLTLLLDGDVAGTKAIWGSKAIWGTESIWGTKAIWGSSSIWSSTLWVDRTLSQLFEVIALPRLLPD